MFRRRLSRAAGQLPVKMFITFVVSQLLNHMGRSWVWPNVLDINILAWFFSQLLPKDCFNNVPQEAPQAAYKKKKSKKFQMTWRVDYYLNENMIFSWMTQCANRNCSVCCISQMVFQGFVLRNTTGRGSGGGGGLWVLMIFSPCYINQWPSSQTPAAFQTSAFNLSSI